MNRLRAVILIKKQPADRRNICRLAMWAARPRGACLLAACCFCKARRARRFVARSCRTSADPRVMPMKNEPSRIDAPAGEDTTTLTISPEKVCFIIVKAREFDAKDVVTEPDPGSNPADDMDAAVLEDHEDDPVLEELRSAINALSEDEQIDLVALAWLGRDDYSASDWPAVREEAARAHNERTADYLLGIPLLGDFLEEGLSMLGYSCEEFEIERL